ncbi:Gp37-like protein [Gordonia paraffinivorans]|uniref:Gp37-like protein n=1 Tax=Gordonia paraffinivorans TaxID=175628 RepID=UPI003FCD7C1C
MTVNTSLPLAEQIDQILAHVEETKRQERVRLRTPMLIRLWDGEFHLQHVVRVFYEAEFEFIDNDTGPGKLVIPYRMPAAKWLKDMNGRVQRGEKRNVNITVDKNGARWGGKLVDVAVEATEDGDEILTATFASAFEELKYYTVRSNPILPAAFQFPRVFMLPGPARWAILTTLWFQLLRQNANLWNIPNDPLDPDEWEGWNMSNWPIVVEPLSFVQDMAAGTIWGMPISRWQNFVHVVKPILEDGELSFVLRHWLEGDPPAWPGANLRHGTLVVGIRDFSGKLVGTSHGGTIFDGLVRTIAEFTEDLLDSTFEAITDTPTTPSSYLVPGNKYTHPQLPYAVYRPGITPGIRSAKFIDTLATAGHVGTGGHSMPGVNELISAGIQMAGDVIGNLLQVGSIGGSIDTLLKPLYEDTVLAWMWVKNVQRTSNAGWSQYFEIQMDNAGKAYTLSSLMVLRAGLWATRTWFSHEIEILDDAPYLIGDKGLGHLFVGSRVGATLPGDPTGEIKMDRISKLVLSSDRDKFDAWTITIGDDKKNLDPAVRAMERIQQIFGALHDLGVG